MRDIKFRAFGKAKKMTEPMDLKYLYSSMPLNFDDFIWMQYTGLKDKNGKEIYEGDIVNVAIKENIGTFNVPDDIIANGGYTGREDVYEGEVIFKDFGFCVNDKKEGEYYLQPMLDTFFEVIGNIYENPELLKNGETK